MGVSAVAPSAVKLTEWTAREQRVIDKGGLAFPLDPAGAVPTGAYGIAGLRTLPPRENGDNFSAKQLTKGAKLASPTGCAVAHIPSGITASNRTDGRGGRQEGCRNR